LIVGGGPAAQPPANLSGFAVQGAGEVDVSDDATSPDQKIASTNYVIIYIIYESKHVVDNSKLLMSEIYGKLQN
jgi:hypothetical protein